MRIICVRHEYNIMTRQLIVPKAAESTKQEILQPLILQTAVTSERYAWRLDSGERCSFLFSERNVRAWHQIKTHARGVSGRQQPCGYEVSLIISHIIIIYNT